MMAEDPYCEVYKAVFACAEAQAGEILRARAAPIVSLRQRHEVGVQLHVVTEISLRRET